MVELTPQQDESCSNPDPARIRANMAISDFVLTDDEMARVSALGSRDGRTGDFDWAPDWD